MAQGIQFLLHILEWCTQHKTQCFGSIGIAKQFDSFIHIVFQIAEAYHLAKPLLLVEHSVGTAECLQESVIFQVLIHIECVEFLGIKACEEHSDNKEKVERFHVGTLLLHAQVDVIIIGAEVVGREVGVEHAVVVVHDSLQLVCRHPVVGEAMVHASLLVILAVIGRVGKHCTDAYLRIELLEYLVVAKQHRDRLYGKQSVEIPIVG